MPPRPRPRLRVLGGAQDGRTFHLPDTVGEAYTLGRALDSSICLKDTETSRHHATVAFDGAEYTLTDNRSTNGTFVNGAFASHAVLQHGDRVRVGETTLVFERIQAVPETVQTGSHSVRLLSPDETDTAPVPEVNATLAVEEGTAVLPAAGQSIEDLRSAHEQLALLHDVNRAVASAVDSDAMLDTIMEQMAEIKDFDRGFIMLFDDRGELELKTEYRRRGRDDDEVLTLSRTVLDRAVQDGVAVLCCDLLNDPQFGAAASIQMSKTRSALCIPLIANAEVLGVLHLDSQSLDNAFSEQDLRLFTIIGNDMASAIANQRMRDRLAARQRIDRDLEIASQIQQDLLPTHTPKDERLQLYARNLPAWQVGGDFYDYFSLGDHRSGVVIGDVSGKGVPAALLMVKGMTDFRTLASEHRESTAAVVTAANQLLARQSLRGMFITLAYVVIDTESLTVQYTNAGHLPPILLRGNGEEQLLDGARGPPVGILADSAYEESTVPLIVGDTICLITDGFIEARNATKDELTMERVRSVARANAGAPQALVEALVRETVNFVGGAPQHDDLTALAVRVG